MAIISKIAEHLHIGITSCGTDICADVYGVAVGNLCFTRVIAVLVNDFLFAKIERVPNVPLVSLYRPQPTAPTLTYGSTLLWM